MRYRVSSHIFYGCPGVPPAPWVGWVEMDCINAGFLQGLFGKICGAKNVILSWGSDGDGGSELRRDQICSFSSTNSESAGRRYRLREH